MVSSFVLFLNPLQRYEEKTVTRIDGLRTKLPIMRFLLCKCPLAGRLFFALAVAELSRGLTRRVLKHPGEVLRVFKAQFLGHVVDGLAA